METYQSTIYTIKLYIDYRALSIHRMRTDAASTPITSREGCFAQVFFRIRICQYPLVNGHIHFQPFQDVWYTWDRCRLIDHQCVLELILMVESPLTQTFKDQPLGRQCFHLSLNYFHSFSKDFLLFAGQYYGFLDFGEF